MHLAAEDGRRRSTQPDNPSTPTGPHNVRLTCAVSASMSTFSSQGFTWGQLFTALRVSSTNWAASASALGRASASATRAKMASPTSLSLRRWALQGGCKNWMRLRTMAQRPDASQARRRLLGAAAGCQKSQAGAGGLAPSTSRDHSGLWRPACK